MPKCIYYDEEHCSENCDSEWVRCFICGKILDFVGDEYELNSYILFHASETCDDYELDGGRVLSICPECFETRIKPLKHKGK